MAKRFTSTEKWNDPWFRKLSLEAKCFWDFICTNADNAGVWEIDWEMASFKIGHPINMDILKPINEGKDRLMVHDSKYLVIFGFIPYQIGDVFSPTLTNLQKSSISLMSKYVNNKGMPTNYFTVMGKLPVVCGYRYKGKGKGKGKGKDKEGGVGETKKPVFDFDLVWAKYPNKDGRKAAERSFHASVKTEQDWLDIQKAVDNYLESENVTKGFIKNGSTWFNNWRDWITPPKKGKNDGIPEWLR